MSKIRAELVATAGAKLKPIRGEPDESFLKRLVATIGNDIDDATWDKISTAAQDWNNKAADAVKANGPLPEFPDAEKPAAAPATRSRRSVAPEPAAAPETVAYEPAVGDEVTVTTARGRTVQGIVVEVVDGMVILNPEGENGAKEADEEFPIDRCTFIPVEPELEGDGDQDADTSGVNENPEVGDTLEVVTARDKTIVGKVDEIGDDSIILIDAAGADHTVIPSKLKSLTIKVKGGAAAEPEPAPAPTGRRGRTTAAATPAAAPAEEAKPGRSKNAPGVSLGARVIALMCADPGLTLEALDAQLTKEGIAFRDTSSKMIRSDTLKVIDCLKALKKLK